MPRPRRRQPDPARFPPCARCGQCYPGGADRWPEGRVCKYCYLQARLRTGTCAGCGALTSLPGLNAAGQPTCTRCSGIPARFRCGCGREVTAGERGRCWWCVLTGLVTDALAGPDGAVPTHLRPLADGLVSMRRPQSGVAWLRRSAITRETLRDLARDRMPCSHAALDAAGADRAVEYLRCCWSGTARCRPATGAWPTSSAGPPPSSTPSAMPSTASCSNGSSAGACCATCGPAAPRRRSATAPTSGPSSASPWRSRSWHGWPTADGNLGECTQHDLDEWFGTGPTTRRHVITFLSWARQQRIIRNVDVPVISTEGAESLPARI